MLKYVQSFFNMEREHTVYLTSTGNLDVFPNNNPCEFVNRLSVPITLDPNETGSRSPCMRPRSDPPNFGPIERGEKQTNNID